MNGCSPGWKCDESDRPVAKDPPDAMVGAELWTAGREESRLTKMLMSPGPIGYVTTPSLQTYSRVHKMAEADGELLGFWKTLLRPKAKTFFTDVAVLDAAIRTLPVPQSLGKVFNCSGKACSDPGRVIPGRDNGAPTDASVWNNLAAAGMVAENGWFYSSACNANRTACIPVVLGNRVWNFEEWCGVAEDNNLPLAITFLGWFGEQIAVKSLYAQNYSFLFYWWQPDDAFLQYLPEMTLFKEEMLPIKQFQHPDKVVWGRLREIDTDLFDFFSRFRLTDVDIQSMVAALNATNVASIACDWVRSNQLKWHEMVPDKTQCPRGSYYDATAAKCRSCRPGTFAKDRGQFGCALCALGSHSSEAEAVECEPCAAGKFSGSLGAVECSFCPKDTLAVSKNMTACDACPAGFRTENIASEDASACVCPLGFYEQKSNGLCTPCPEGTTCGWGSREVNLFTDKPRPCLKNGYMSMAGSPMTVYRCALAAKCPGEREVGSCDGDPEEVACGRCPKGAFESADGMCVSCGGGPHVIGLVFTIILLLGAFVLAAIFLNRDILTQSGAATSTMILLGILFTVVQTLSVFAGFKIQWPAPIQATIRALVFASLDVRFLRLECYIKVNLVAQFLARQFIAPVSIPVVMCALLARKRLSKSTAVVWKDVVNTTGTIFLILFVSLVLVAVAPFVCYMHPGTSGESMISQPSILCFGSEEHWGMVTIGVISFVLVPIPFLGFCAFVTWRYPQYLARYTPHSMKMIQAVRFLFSRFKPSAYFYGTFLLVRNLCICLVPVVIRDVAAVQVVVMSLIISFSGIIQALIRPWRVHLTNWVDGITSPILVLFLMVGAVKTDFNISDSLLVGMSLALLTGMGATFLGSLTFVAMKLCCRTHDYTYFVCHHKAAAAAQARLLQLVLRAATGKSCFLDSDDLRHLGDLFEIVRSNVKHLLVYLTAQTLKRPWCAGEIATAYRNKKRTTRIVHPSFVALTDLQLQDSGGLLDSSSVNLMKYYISTPIVAEAYRWLASDAVANVTFSPDLIGRAKFEAIVSGVLKAEVRCTNRALGDWSCMSGMLLVSSDAEDDEATASAAVLALKVQQKVDSFVYGGVHLLSDSTGWTVAGLCDICLSAHAVVVMLTKGSLQSQHQLPEIFAIAKMVEQCATLPYICVATPSFEFPPEEYYLETLPNLRPRDFDPAAAWVRSLFVKITISFPTHLSDFHLEATMANVVAAIPERCMKHKTTGTNSLQPTEEAAGATPSSQVGGEQQVPSLALEYDEVFMFDPRVVCGAL